MLAPLRAVRVLCYRCGMKMFRFVAAAALSAAFSLTTAGAQMMGPQPKPLTAAQFAATMPGQFVQIEVRVTGLRRTEVRAQLVERSGERTAKATGANLTLFFPSGTPVVMGSQKDVAPNAVLFVYGVLTKPLHVDVKRVVVLTPYVVVR